MIPPLHPQVQALLEAAQAAAAPPLHSLSPDEAREVAARIRLALGEPQPVAVAEELHVPGRSGQIRIRRYEPIERAGDDALVWCHGGGWVLLDVEDADACCRRLANAAGCTVVSVGYRRAPEHRWPAASDDLVDVLHWLADRQPPGARLLVGGDSAGGNLAAVAALRARDEGGPALALQLLVYPVTDHDFTTPSYEQSGHGLVLRAELMQWFWHQYQPDVEQRSHPHASPLRAADLAGLPEAIVVSAGHDPLRSEVLAYADRLEAAGVAVTRLDYRDMQHGFFTLPGLLDRADEAIEAVGTTIRKASGR